MSQSAQLNDDGQKQHTILSMIIANAWKDADYKAKLLNNPQAVLQEEGISFSPGVKIIVLQDTPTLRHVSLTRNIDLIKDADKISSIWGNVLPIPPGVEVSLVQSTENIRYLVIPNLPPNVNTETTPDEHLRRFAVANTTTNAVTTSQVTTTVECVAAIDCMAVSVSSGMVTVVVT